MIPFVEEPRIALGPIELPAFGLLAALAVLLGYELVVRRAPRLGLDRRQVSGVVTWTLIWGFVGAHLFHVVAYTPERLRDPLALLRLQDSMSSFGGMLGGLLAGWVVAQRRGWSRSQALGFVDLVGFGFPFAWVLGRLGCALGHHHLGVASSHWLAVDFPGGPRFDLGLIEMLATLCIALLFAVLNRLDRQPPFYLGLFLLLYGPLRFGLDTLRIGDARYLGWTPAQYLALLVTGLGAALLWRSRKPSRA